MLKLYIVWPKICISKRFKYKVHYCEVGDSLWGIVFVENTFGNDIRYEKLESLPPSAKLVFKVLEANGRMTQKDIIRETILPSRTVRYALNRLKDEQILMERFNFIDSRQSFYEINGYSNEVPAT